MTIGACIRSCILAGSALLSSCAYMQTHKNIEESYRQSTGYAITPSLELYKAGNEYYLAVEKMSVRMRYPVIHDSIFLTGSNEPVLERTNPDTQIVYRHISRGTALVLQAGDGYADLTTLSDELRNDGEPWLTSLPAGASRCHTKAEIAGKGITWKEEDESVSPPLSVCMLSTVDRVFIDWPGTILYNAAIPVMAPFVFFHEFLNDN